ncbi:hypothetical protein LJR290_006889 [Variovorax sp. LjRoot290]|uniref:hypothetical protein n=1 Tax=unclassified Variovorax TaxID=663243 RepID=UPI003ED11385
MTTRDSRTSCRLFRHGVIVPLRRGKSKVAEMTEVHEETSMKKRYWLRPVVVALGVYAGTALAAQLENLSGQSCGDSTGTWHFVNNQTGGAGAGTLSATWSSGNSCSVSPSKVLQSTQHFNCTGAGTLLSASTNLPGRLVLSDFSCETKEPPPCDPKKEICK